jgi:hypothetical protein
MKTSNKTQQEQFLMNHWPAVVFLLHYGAGTFEIAKMVEQQDIEKMFTIIEDIAKQLKLSK